MRIEKIENGFLIHYENAAMRVERHYCETLSDVYEFMKRIFL